MSFYLNVDISKDKTCPSITIASISTWLENITDSLKKKSKPDFHLTLLGENWTLSSIKSRIIFKKTNLKIKNSLLLTKIWVLASFLHKLTASVTASMALPPPSKTWSPLKWERCNGPARPYACMHYNCTHILYNCIRAWTFCTKTLDLP